MLTELALSALTDVILACLQAFAAGLLFRPDQEKGSASRLWAWTMALIALLFLIGAIDHGFFEPVDHPYHAPLLTVNRVLVALASLMIALTAARQFLGQRGRQVVLGLGGAGALAMAVMIVLSDNFFIVIGGYSVAMLFLLALNLAALRRQPGAAAMVAGVVITFAASALPLVGYQGFAGLGVYGSYHVAMMPAVLAFYWGGLGLNRRAPL
jgi:hypothetical protein